MFSGSRHVSLLAGGEISGEVLPHWMVWSARISGTEGLLYLWRLGSFRNPEVNRAGDLRDCESVIAMIRVNK